jgi:hypothetical protein
MGTPTGMSPFIFIKKMHYMSNINSTTPIETYMVDKLEVFVKREDLFGKFPAPSLGKLRGLNLVLEKVVRLGYNLVGCWDTRISKLGQGVAVLGKEYPDLSLIISYPTKKGEKIPDAINIAKYYGAEIYPIRGNHVGICYAQVRKYVESRKGFMLPFGLECTESFNAIHNEASLIQRDLIENGTLIISCGSGVTLAGILSGLRYVPSKVIGISSGRSLLNINNCISRYIGVIPNYVEVIKPQCPYSEKLLYFSPFPSDPYYDLKAWKYLVENIKYLKRPILFWNIGG